MYKKLFPRFMILTIFVVLIMALVHECGHILFCILSGGNVSEIGYQEHSPLIVIIYVNNQYPNETARIVGCIGGSLFECIVAFILCKIIYKYKKGKFFFLGCGLSFVSNGFYWGMSPLIIGCGDGYNFCIATKINPLLISGLGFIGMGISCVILFHYWVKIMDLIVQEYDVEVKK